MTHIDKIKVTKRDGRLEPIDLDKIHKVIEWAADGLDNVSVSQVELKSHIQFYEASKPVTFTRPSSSQPLTSFLKTRLTISIWLRVWPFSICVRLPTIVLPRRICLIM